jgi:hypothetical protein
MEKDANVLSTVELGRKLLEECRAKGPDLSLLGKTFVARVSSVRPTSETSSSIVPFRRTKNYLMKYLMEYKVAFRVLVDLKEMMHFLEGEETTGQVYLFLNPEGKNIQLVHSRKQGYIFLGLDERGNWVSKGVLGRNESRADYWTTVNNPIIVLIPDRERLNTIVEILQKEKLHF